MATLDDMMEALEASDDEDPNITVLTGAELMANISKGRKDIFEEDDDEEVDAEADLTEALMLLEDCLAYFQEVKKFQRFFTPHMNNRTKKLRNEVLAFTLQYEDVPGGDLEDTSDDSAAALE